MVIASPVLETGGYTGANPYSRYQPGIPDLVKYCIPNKKANQTIGYNDGQL